MVSANAVANDDGVARFGYRDAGTLYHHAYVLPAIGRLLPKAQHLKVLDAGCGNGSLTAWLAAQGHELTGVDVAEDGLAFARQQHAGPRFELRSVYDDLSDLMPVGGWDLIVSSEVIEHLFAPTKFLNNLFGLLRPDGQLIVTTPYHGYLKNIALSLANGWDRHFDSTREGGHIKFFSPRTLGLMVEAAGFQDIAFSHAGRLPCIWKSMICHARRPR